MSSDLLIAILVPIVVLLLIGVGIGIYFCLRRSRASRPHDNGFQRNVGRRPSSGSRTELHEVNSTRYSRLNETNSTISSTRDSISKVSSTIDYYGDEDTRGSFVPDFPDATGAKQRKNSVDPKYAKNITKDNPLHLPVYVDDDDEDTVIFPDSDVSQSSSASRSDTTRDSSRGMRDRSGSLPRNFRRANSLPPRGPSAPTRDSASSRTSGRDSRGGGQHRDSKRSYNRDTDTLLSRDTTRSSINGSVSRDSDGYRESVRTVSRDVPTRGSGRPRSRTRDSQSSSGYASAPPPRPAIPPRPGSRRPESPADSLTRAAPPRTRRPRPRSSHDAHNMRYAIVTEVFRLKKIMFDGFTPRSFYRRYAREVPNSPTQIVPELNLFVGNQPNADNLELLGRLGITHVLKLNPECRSISYKDTPFRITRLRIDADDRPMFKIVSAWGNKDVYSKAKGFIRRALDGNGKVMVHCNMGVNRSVTICVAYLLEHTDRGLEELIKCIKAKRKCALTNSGFLGQLVEFSARLGKFSPPPS